MTQNGNPKEEFRKLLLDKLPPIIARKEVPFFLGGVISIKTLANADSLGDGPLDAFRLGKNIVYPTEALVDWLIDSFHITRPNTYANQCLEAINYARLHG